MVHEIIRIQSSWRSYKCRKKVKYFSYLPSDVWQIILNVLCKNNEKFLTMERIVFKKLILFTWAAPKVNFESKLKLINFVSKSPLSFGKKIIDQCLELCKRLIMFTTEKIRLCYVNSCVERIVSSQFHLDCVHLDHNYNIAIGKNILKNS
jgi:hypothetical protein